MIVTTPPSRPYIPWYQKIELFIVLPSAILGLLMVWSVVQSVASANWAEGLGVLVVVALPAFMVGLVFARLPWLPGWLAHMLSTVLGLAWAVQATGGLLQREVQTEFGPVLAERLGNWSDRASEIVIRTLALARIVQAGGRGEDIVLFIIALALLVWALAYATSWLLFRQHWTWAAVLINALVILVNYTFTLPKPNTLFFVFLVAALLLIVHQHISQQQQRWSAALIDFPEWMPTRFLMAAAFVVGTTALITSILPGNVSSAQAARTWRLVSSPFTAVREGWETAFSTIQAPPGTSGSGFFTRSMRVGGGRSLGDNVVLRVRSSDYDYWRAIARDRYTGRAWENTVGERARADIGVTTAEAARIPLDGGAFIAGIDPNTAVAGRKLVTQTVELAQERADNLLVVGGQFASAGIPVLIEQGFDLGTTPPTPNYSEIAGIFAQIPLQSTSTYTVASYISTADIASLEAASTDYPDWIASTYLQLPDTVTARTRDRAREIVTTANAATAYDKAVAVQNYLRTLTYDESRPAPPTDSDWVDYFLFSGLRGYCDDFATAMIVMLRAEGVPARLVQGYAGGTFDPQLGSYVVRESVAHSWPEVYFPGLGWQRFEPTPASYTNVPVRPQTSDTDTSTSSSVAGLPDLSRSQDLSELEDLLQERNAQNTDVAALLAAQRQAELQRTIQVALGVVAVLGVLLALVYYRFNRNMRGLSPAAAAYARMTRLASWSGVQQDEHLTPHEYGTALRKVMPTHRTSVDTIVEGYVRERYKGEANPADYQAEWRNLRRPLFVHLFGRFFERPKRNK